MSNSELALLMKKAKKNNADAFAKIYSYFARRIYFKAFRITNNEQDANDIVQETMTVLYKRLEDMKSAESMMAFVNKTATNFAISQLRKRREYLVDDDEFFENTSQEEEFLPENYVENKDIREQIVKSIDELPAAQRTAVMLFYFDGYSIKEISKELNISDGTVKSRLYYAKESIKKALAGGNMKGAVITIVSVSVLSRVLEIQSAASYAPEISLLNWEKIGKNINLKDTEILKTSKIVTEMPSVLSKAPLASTYGSIIAKAGAISSKAIISSIVAGGIIVSGVSLGASYVSSVKNDYSPNNTFNNYDKTAQESSANSLLMNDQGLVYVEKTITSLDNQETTVYVPTIDNELKSNENSESIGSMLENKATESKDKGVIVKGKQVDNLIEKLNPKPLSYPKGTNLDIQRIINDAKVYIHPEAELKVDYMDWLNSNKTEENFIYLTATKGNDKKRIVVIIKTI